jgi:hypothetical protein
MHKIGCRFFRFYDEENDKSYVIPLEDLVGQSQWGHASLDDDFYYDNILPKIDERELEIRYGIHDFSTHGPDMIIGYTSNEVDEDKIPALMKEWKEIFYEVGIITGDLEIHDGEVE